MKNSIDSSPLPEFWRSSTNFDYAKQWRVTTPIFGKTAF